MDNLAARVISAIVHGLIIGFIVFLVLIVISMILPGVSIDAAKWGMIVGMLASLYVFFTGNSTVR